MASSKQQSQAQGNVPSEEIISQKTDLCLSNAIVKTGIGFSTGVVLSVLLFKRRAWPVHLGTGFGLGSGWTDCERSFNPVSVPGVRILPAGSPGAAAGAAQTPSSTFERLQQRAGEAFGSAREKAGAQAEKAEDKATDLVGKAQNTAESLAGKAQNKAESLASDAKSKGKEALEAAKEKGQEVKQEVRRVV